MTSETFLTKVASYFLRPFASWETFVGAAAGIPNALTDFGSKTAWPYLLSSLLVAWALHGLARRRGWIDPRLSLRQFLFPATVYRHRSAIVDYKFVAIDLSIKALIYSPVMSGFSYLIYKTLQPRIEPLLVADLPLGDPLTRGILLTVIAVMLTDLGFYISHFLMHRVPALWYFHEVHHSAEVLTPVTVYRVHPVEELVNASVAAVLSAFGASVYTAVRGSELDIITIHGANVLWFAFFMVAFQLRHSGIWLSYGPILSRIFISPAQHQIHHSVDARHWDRNYGYLFGLWDWMFKTLYVPGQRETLRFGVPGDPQDFSTVRKLYFLPFVKAGRRLWQGVRGAQPSPRSVGQVTSG